MRLELVAPLVLGFAAVLQATLNKQIAGQAGLAAATLLNMLVATLFAAGLAVVCAMRGDAAGVLRWTPDVAAFRIWWLVPGAVGFLIVLGLPWSVQRVGALPTFVVLVTAQVLASALWDHFASGVPMSPSRWLGAACAIAGVVLLGRNAAP